MKNNLTSILFLIFLFIYFFSICYAQTAPDILWTNTFGGDNMEYAYSVQQTSEGGFAIVGCTSSYGAGNFDVWIVKTDESGNEEWNQAYGGAEDDCAYDVRQTSDGGFIIVGYSDSFGPGYHNVYLIKADEQGNEEWYRTFGNYDNRGKAVQQTDDGGYIITGNTKSNPVNGLWIIKTDEQGNVTWNIIYDDNGYENGNSIGQTIDGGYIIAGEKKNNGSVWSDFLLVRVDSDSVTSVNDIITENHFSSHPNPFTTSTIINYTLPSNIREAEIEIFNIKGQKIEELSINNNQSSVEWNAYGLAPGIYFHRLSTDTDKIVKKMILLR